MKIEKKGLILTGGSIDIEFVRSFLKENRPDYIIAVDRGLMAAYALNLPVHVIVGDFDSVSHSVLEYYEHGSQFEMKPRIKRLVPEKDMTDTQVAIELAIEEGIMDITIIGATGTRMDHLLANINLLMIPLRNQVKACILDKNNKLYLKNQSFCINKEDAYGNYVSLLPLTEEVTGVTLRGMKYPLEQYTMVQGDSLGVSNEITSDVATVEIGEGTLIVIEALD